MISNNNKNLSIINNNFSIVNNKENNINELRRNPNNILCFSFKNEQNPIKQNNINS